MNIKEIIEQKNKLEREIERLIREFEKDCGVSIRDIRLETIVCIGEGEKKMVELEVCI